MWLGLPKCHMRAWKTSKQWLPHTRRPQSHSVQIICFHYLWHSSDILSAFQHIADVPVYSLSSAEQQTPAWWTRPPCCPPHFPVHEWPLPHALAVRRSSWLRISPAHLGLLQNETNGCSKALSIPLDLPVGMIGRPGVMRVQRGRPAPMCWLSQPYITGKISVPCPLDLWTFVHIPLVLVGGPLWARGLAVDSIIHIHNAVSH